MSYIGVIPAEAYASFYVQHFTTSATASYALDYPVTNENELRLVINNVVQQPGSGKAYTAAASTLTLSEATTSSDTMYAVFLGRALQTINPPAGSVGTSQIEALAVTSAKLASDSVITAKILDDNVTTAKILDNNVTLAKLADGTQGDILYYGASGAPALLGFGTSGDFLKTQGTGANPVWATVGGGVLQVKAVEVTDVQSNTATAPAAITAFNIVFTPTSASSKLWLQTSITVGASSTAIMGYFYDSTGAVIIGPIADAAGSRSRYSFGTGTPANQSKMTIGAGAWFTPGDTTARTIQVFLAAQSTNTLYINRGYTDTDDNTIDHSRGASTFVITEYDGSLVTIA